jgi:hypothetical protein
VARCARIKVTYNNSYLTAPNTPDAKLFQVGFAFAERRSIYTALRFRLSSTIAFPLLTMRRRVSTGVYSGLPSPINAYCRVMITTYYKSALCAFVDTNSERHLLPVAAVAAYLARVSWVYSFKRPASVFSFAFSHLEKAPPGHIADCSGQTAILDHPAYVQIFDRDRVKSSDQIGRYLVMKIFATTRDFQMGFGDFDSLLRAPLRSFLSARKSPLLLGSAL